MSGKKIKSLYQMIIDSIIEQISRGKLSCGDQIPTEKQLCQSFNVSRITVTRAIKELEYSGIVERIKGKGTFIRKSLAQPVQHIQTGKEHMKIISIVMPFNADTDFELMGGIGEACQENGFTPAIHNTIHNAWEEERILRDLLYKKIEGIVLYPYFENENIGAISSLLIHKVPIVFIDRKISGMRLPCVSSDNFQGGHTITRFLIEQGHKRIAFVTLSEYYLQPEEERLAGYYQALVENEIEIKRDYVFTAYGVKNITMDQKIDMALDFLFKQPLPPTAIVGVCDFISLALMAKAIKRGYKIPEDLSITGFDDIPYARLSDPPLTTVKQPRRKIGREAIRQLLNIKKNEVKDYAGHIELKTELIIRESTQVI